MAVKVMACMHVPRRTRLYWASWQPVSGDPARAGDLCDFDCSVLGSPRPITWRSHASDSLSGWSAC